MKTFKQFILTVNEEISLHQWTPPSIPGALEAGSNNFSRPGMMPYHPDESGEERPQDWYFGYNNHYFWQLPWWLRKLYVVYNFADLVPLLGDALDVIDVWRMIQDWLAMQDMTEAEKEEMGRIMMMQWFQQHPNEEFGNENPWELMQNVGKMWWAYNGQTYQLYKWNPVTQNFEPFGEPLDHPPYGNEHPIYDAPGYVPYSPPFGVGGAGGALNPVSDRIPADYPVYTPYHPYQDNNDIIPK